MTKKIDDTVTRKFAAAAAILMTRVFSTPLPTNARRLMFASGPASPGSQTAQPAGGIQFDVLGLGFKPGREWKGPTEIFVEEMRDGELKVWTNCRFWRDALGGPLYLLTEDPDVCFSFDGHTLVPLSGSPDDPDGGAQRARASLRAAARLVPDDLEQFTMM